MSLVLLNALSLSRLPLAAVFLLTPNAWARAGLVVAAALTDFLDGWIARHNHLTTRWGALIDPIADRAFALTALVVLLVEGALLPVELCLLLIRDLATGLGFLLARVLPRLRAVEFKARLLGKIVTTVQFAALLAALLAPAWVGPLALVAGLTALGAVVDYTGAVWRARAR